MPYFISTDKTKLVEYTDGEVREYEVCGGGVADHSREVTKVIKKHKGGRGIKKWPDDLSDLNDPGEAPRPGSSKMQEIEDAINDGDKPADIAADKGTSVTYVYTIKAKMKKEGRLNLDLI